MRPASAARWLLPVIAVAIVVLVVLAPLAVVIVHAMSGGVTLYIAALTDAEAQEALELTALVTIIVVTLNTLFGVAAAWALTKYRTRATRVLMTLVDLPLAVSPVVAGMLFVLVFGARGWFGPWLDAHGLRIIFATPGIVIATSFVTLPLVARELIPLMQALGNDEEESALMLGASGWQMLTRVTLPNVKWALLYGMILCNARAMGEFGAASVVSGHIRGVTTTLPLHVEMLYNEYNYTGAFAVASLLVLMALLTIVARLFLERWSARQS